MKTTNSPRFRTLNTAEIEEILARNHVGRLAFARENHVDIEPIHYVYSNGWLYGRTSPGRKLEAIGGKWRPVAFEVDEVEDLFSWRSVVVRGGFYVIDAEGGPAEREERQRAIGLLRRLVPQTNTADDPVSFRNVLFRIAVQDATGRAAEPAPDSLELP